MSQITYKKLYSLTVEEIDKRLQFNTVTSYNDKSRASTVKSIPGDVDSSISSVQYNLSEALASTILDGLEVEETTPVSKKVIVNPGSGTANGILYTLTGQTLVEIPFEGSVFLYYIVLYSDSVRVQKDKGDEGVLLAKIVVPKPGVTAYVRNEKDRYYNAYIQNFKEYKLYGFRGKFEEDTMELLRNNMSPILGDMIIGNLKLSENLKIINTSGSMVLDSNSMQFFNTAGQELAYFGSTLARVGNIRITPSTIQSGNYVSNTAGFIIRDNGNVEFNDMVLRGTIYTSTISENLYIQEGVDFIGTLNLSQSNITLDAGYKLIFDSDLGADTYWVYNSATQYLEGWVDGVKRVEL